MILQDYSGAGGDYYTLGLEAVIQQLSAPIEY